MSLNFLSCDWGTSHFRLRLVATSTLDVLAEVKTAEGAARIFSEGGAGRRSERFEEILLTHATALFRQANCTTDRCVISGMASSSIGWVELPYARAPLTLDAANLRTHPLRIQISPGHFLNAVLVSGISTDDDVMRGEECELLGLIQLEPALMEQPCHAILPGTHSKHLRINGQTLEGFTTFLTGEIYGHLHSIPTLKVPLSGDGDIRDGEFLEGVETVEKLGLLASLFKTRSRTLLPFPCEVHPPSFLSGILIGSELLSLQNAATVFLASSEPLRRLYTLAASQLGLPLRQISSDVLQRALLHAHRSLLFT